MVGEEDPAREGLRHNHISFYVEGNGVGEVVPAREGLRQVARTSLSNLLSESEKWFQQEKD